MNAEWESARPTAADGSEITTAAKGMGPSGSDRQVWIIDWWRDLLFFVATPLLIVPLVFLLQTQFATSAIFLVVLTFGAVGHQLPGYLRAYGDRSLFARYRTRLLLAPVVMLAIAFGSALAGLSGLAIILLGWGFWHILTQHYGFLRIYDSKYQSFEVATIRLDFLMCLCWFGAGIVYSPARMYDLLNAYYQAGGPLLDPMWVHAVRLVWALLTAIVTIAFVMNYVAQRRHGQDPNLVKLIAMASGIGLWWFAMVNVRDALMGILLFELFHMVQYLALVYFFCRRLSAQGAMRSVASRPFRHGVVGLAVYLGVILLFGLPAFLVGITPTWLEFDASQGTLVTAVYAMVAASTLLHFYYDSFVWQVREKDLRIVMDLPDAPLETRSAWSLTDRVPHALKWSFLLLPLAGLGYAQWTSDGPAAATLVNLSEAVPASWEARSALGAQLLSEGRMEEAIKELKEAHALRPSAAAPVLNLGRALRLQNNFAEALEYFEQATDLNPDSFEAEREYGVTLFSVGELDEGRQHLTRAVGLAPDTFSAQWDCGVTMLGVGETETGRRLLERAMELAPDTVEAQWECGKKLFGVGELEAGRRHLKRALELSSGNPAIHYDLALAEATAGNLEQALDAIETAIKLDDTQAAAFNARGNIYLNLNDLQQAIADYDKALEIDPEFVKAYRNRAMARAQQGDLRGAEEDWTAAINLDDSNSRDFVLRGDILYALGDYDKARADYAIAMSREQMHVEPVERMIRLLTTCPDESYRDSKLAVSLADSACKMTGYADPRALILLADTYAAVGNLDEAIRWYEQAIPLSPPAIQLELRKRIEQYEQAKNANGKEAPEAHDAGEVTATDSSEAGQANQTNQTNQEKQPQ